MLLLSEDLLTGQESALRHMLEMGSKASASSSIEGNNERFRRKTSMGNSKKPKVEDSHGGGREMSLGECWFTIEILLVESQALFRLEK